MERRYWLMESEPSAFSFDYIWGGMYNYTARNNMIEMKKGDLIFFHH